MKFSCDSRILSPALRSCAQIARPSSTYPATRNVFIETVDDSTVKLSVTDQMSIIAIHTVSDVTVKEQGTALVDAGSLSVFTYKCSGNLSFSVTKGGQLSVRSGDKRLALRQSAVPLVFQPPPDEARFLVEVDGKILSGLLDISYMADKGSVNLDGIFFMSGDDYLYSMAAKQGRVAYVWAYRKGVAKSKFFLPPKAAAMLSRYMDNRTFKIYLDSSSGDKIWFMADDLMIGANQLSGEFPYQYLQKMVVQDRPHSVVVLASEFTDALSTCFELAKTDDNAQKKVVFRVDADGSNQLEIQSVEENQIGFMNWPMSIENKQGRSFKFELSTAFLEEILRAIDKLAANDSFSSQYKESEITLAMNEFDGMPHHICLTSNNADAMFIIAPMGKPEFLDEILDTDTDV